MDKGQDHSGLLKCYADNVLEEPNSCTLKTSSPCTTELSNQTIWYMGTLDTATVQEQIDCIAENHVGDQPN